MHLRHEAAPRLVLASGNGTLQRLVRLTGTVLLGLACFGVRAQTTATTSEQPILRITQSSIDWVDALVSTDGNTAATASRTAAITQITSLKSGRAVAFLPAVGPIAMANDGSTVVVGASNGVLHAWRSGLPGVAPLAPCHSGQGPIEAIKVSPTGRVSYAADVRGDVRACNLDTGQLIWKTSLGAKPWALEMSSDGSRLLAAWGWGALPSPNIQTGGSALIHAATGKLISRFDREFGYGVIAAALSHDSRRAYTVRDGTSGIAVWQADSRAADAGHLIGTLIPNTGVSRMVAAPNANKLAILDDWGNVTMIDSEVGKVLWSVSTKVDFGFVEKLQFIANGRQLIAGVKSSAPVVLDADTGVRADPLPSVENVPIPVSKVRVNARADIAALSGPGFVSVWNLQLGTPLLMLGRGHFKSGVVEIPLSSEVARPCLSMNSEVAPSGRYVAISACDDEIYLFDTGTRQTKAMFGKVDRRPQQLGGYVFSPDGRFLFANAMFDRDATTLLVWKEPFDKAPTELPIGGRLVIDLGISAGSDIAWAVTIPDFAIREKEEKGTMIATVDLRTLVVSRTALKCIEFPTQCRPTDVIVSPRGNFAAFWGFAHANVVKLGQDARTFDVTRAAFLPKVLAFSCDDSQLLAGDSFDGFTLIDTRSMTGRPVKLPTLQRGATRAQRLQARLDCDGSLVTLADGVLRRIKIDGDEDSTLRYVPSSGEIRDFDLPRSGNFVAAAGDIGLHLFDREGARQIATLMTLRDGASLVVAPDGRFDTKNFDTLSALNWVLPQRPRRAIPFEAFMRPYFEPRLLSKLRQPKEEVRPPMLTTVNTIQPIVRAKAFRRVAAGEGADEAEITVEVAEGVDDSARSGAYDLRLFRNEQLVGQYPRPRSDVGQVAGIKQWRATSLIPIEDGAGSTRATFRVALPTHEDAWPVKFTAYAFNEDKIKSETVSVGQIEAPVTKSTARSRKAYVITVGVNRYDLGRRDLSFAAKDARNLGTALASIKDHEVVLLTLVSEAARPGVPATRQATKANIRAVLELLAGRSESERARLAGVAGIDKKAVERLRKATPDDLVVIAFSGHGYTDPGSGQFYLLPSDSGKEPGFGPRVLAGFVSSEELSQWLREVDAGQLAMIIDACHSASAVDQPGFKPGPMGDRGLGQLAYDKGMMILAATQASDVALEVQKIQQGLLTYALVVDGFQEKGSGPRRRNADLDEDGVLSLKEWLQYGERRVPSLYEDIRAGRVKAVHRDPRPSADWRDATADKAQTPSLFDFQRGTRSAELKP